MDETKYKGRYRIPSARAWWHDYSGGLYYVTICTKRHERYFGEIKNGEMHLSKVGEFADVQFQNVSSHYPYAEIPLWIIMPNHIHCIIVVDANKTKYDRRVVETWRAASLQQNDTLGATPHVMSPREIANMQGWLSVAIGGLKSSITRFANENGIAFGWQTRFHDHIVRNVEELNAIAKYIENNVANWKEDEFNDAM